jgi:hypothetical protein
VTRGPTGGESPMPRPAHQVRVGSLEVWIDLPIGEQSPTRWATCTARVVLPTPGRPGMTITGADMPSAHGTAGGRDRRDSAVRSVKSG